MAELIVLTAEEAEAAARADIALRSFVTGYRMATDGRWPTLEEAAKVFEEMIGPIVEPKLLN